MSDTGPNEQPMALVFLSFTFFFIIYLSFVYFYLKVFFHDYDLDNIFKLMLPYLMDFSYAI